MDTKSLTTKEIVGYSFLAFLFLLVASGIAIEVMQDNKCEDGKVVVNTQRVSGCVSPEEAEKILRADNGE